MSAESPPTLLEMQLGALSVAYGMSAQAVIELAVHNLAVLASFQTGHRRDAGPHDLFRLLLAPGIASPARPGDPPRPPERAPAPQEPAPAPRAWTSPTEARDLVLAAARARQEPFTSAEMAAETGISAAAVGTHLGRARWAKAPARPGAAARWLPKK